jgi:hypothetical protein
MTAGIVPGLSLPVTVAIIATIIVESIVYIVAIRQEFWKVLWYCLLINLFTVPLANLFYGVYYGISNYSFLIIEFFVFLVEFVLLMLLFKIKWWKALIISFAANLASMTFGVILFLFLQFV